MISPDQLAAALAAGDPEVDAAVARAADALAAWRAWPDCLRAGYQAEARRLARRAAAAIVAVVEAADKHTPEEVRR
jgi:hypothetical protein